MKRNQIATFDLQPLVAHPKITVASPSSPSFQSSTDININSSDQSWPWYFETLSVPETMPSGNPWPKISVITVSYNQGSFIEETIRSVLLQNYPNLEYIVIDGNSSDNTGNILNRYKNELHYCVSEPDSGQSNALNKGFQIATGEILAWINSDDRYLPRTLVNVALAFEKYQTDLVVGGCLLVYDRQREFFQNHHSCLPIGEPIPLPLHKLLDIDGSWQMGDFFYQPEVFWQRNIWEKSGAYVNENLHYSMDYELWVRMAAQEASIAHIPESLALYRMHQGQKTFGDSLPFYPELVSINNELKLKYL